MSSLSIAPAFTPIRPRPQVRLTRRGRLVVFVASLLVVLAVALTWAASAVGTSEAGTPTSYDSWVVGDGETLGGIARATGSSVLALEQLNHLTSAEIMAGQTLRVPAAD